MAQFGRPSADTVIGTWVDEAGGTTNIYTHIDEASESTADYIKSPTPPASAEFETLLTSVTDPVSSTGHIMRWSARKFPISGSADCNLAVRLMEGATQRVSRPTNAITGDWGAATSYTLSGAEADSITNYADLRLEFVATQV